MNEPLSISGVSKAFADRMAVTNLSFAVREGEIFGFLGENGAGKTTTIRMVLDIIQPDEGSISVFGSRPGAEHASRIGFLAEERGLYAKMTAIETIQYFGRLKGMRSGPARKEGLAILERFGLANRANSPIGEMSKGMAQKVQLATALVNSPDLLILDEPFSGLDPVNQELLEREIAAAAARGAAVVFSTHIMQNAERLCDRMLILKKGEKRFEGTLAEAQAGMPGSVTLATHARTNVASLTSAPGVVSTKLLDAQSDADWSAYAVTLKPGISGDGLLEHCTRQGMVMRRFEENRQSMHDIFMWHVGKETGQ